MSLKKYFQLLGLPENASQQDIRKNYRKLAMRLHPDRNPSPVAQEDFLKLTEAYEILIGKKSAPKTSRSVSKSTEKTAQERVNEARKRYAQQVEKERLANERYFLSLFKGTKWKVIQLFSVVGIVLSFAILVDTFAPRHLLPDKITEYAIKNANGESLIHQLYVKTEKNHGYWLENTESRIYSESFPIEIEASWLFHEPIYLISNQKIFYKKYPIIYNFYSVYWLLMIIFLLPLFIRVFKRQQIWYTMAYQFSLYFSSSIMVLFLFLDDHWAHLLSLGFL